jgi:hypothetical protein
MRLYGTIAELDYKNNAIIMGSFEAGPTRDIGSELENADVILGKLEENGFGDMKQGERASLVELAHKAGNERILARMIGVFRIRFGNDLERNKDGPVDLDWALRHYGITKEQIVGQMP